MNINQKNKQCPRCRSILFKTHSDKLICKKCGYTSNKLQIVTQQDTFNANIRFNKRVSLSRKQIPYQLTQAKTQNTLQIYLKHYQHVLKYLGNTFFTQNIKQGLIQRQNLINSFKNLWFTYLQKMSRQGNVITGIFTSLVQKSDKKQTKKQQSQNSPKKQQKSEQSQSESQKQQNKEQSQQQNKQEYKRKLSRSSIKQKEEKKQNVKIQQNKKDIALVEFKKIVNKTIKTLQKNSTTKKTLFFRQIVQKQFLDVLLNLSQQKVNDSSYTSIVYLAQKYSWILVLSKTYLQRNKKQIENKLQNKYISQEDIKSICNKRNITYEKRKLFTYLTILSYDLLQQWYKNKHRNAFDYFDNQQGFPYPYLLEVYKQQLNKPPILETVMKYLQYMSQKAVIKMEQNIKKVPQLSFKFICALIYLTTLIHHKTFTILQIINQMISNLQRYVEQIQGSYEIQKKQIVVLMVRQRNVQVRRVKKISNQLMNYLQNYIGQQSLYLQKWSIKFSKLFGFGQKNIKEINLLVELLIKGMNEQNDENGSVNINGNRTVIGFSNRYLFIQQTQILLAAILIYLKLKFGLDRGGYGYLKNIGQIWTYIKDNKNNLKQQDKERIQYMEKIITNKQVFGINQYGQSQLSLVNILRNIRKSYRPIQSQLQLKYLSNKNIKQMIKKMNKYREMKRDKNKLNLIYNLYLNKMHEQENKEIKVKFIQNRDERQINQLFRQFKEIKEIKIRQQVSKSIDYIIDRQRIYKEKIKLQQQKNKKQKKKKNNKSRNKLDSKNQIKNNPNNEFIQKQQFNNKQMINQSQNFQNEQNDQKNLQAFKLQSYVDHPQTNYQIIYDPTINVLLQLNYQQLLILVQNLSLLINGQHSDCRDILQWVGMLQSVLKQFQI